MEAHPIELASHRLRRLAGPLFLLAVLLLTTPRLAWAQLPAGSLRPIEPRTDQRILLRADHHNSGTRVLPADEIVRKTLPKTATFIVNYNGFTPAAEAAFQHAVDIWEQLITSPVPIRIEATWEALDPGLLGGAAANAYRSDGVFVYPDALADSLAGFDLGEGDFDIFASFSNTAPWYLGTDGNPPGGQYDLVTVVMHEIAHGLGFAGLMTVQSGVGFWFFDLPSIYAAFTEDLGGTSLINQAAYPDFSIQLGNVLQSGNVFFAGPMAVSTNGGVRPELYAPAPWIDGSSYSHLDEAVFPAGDPDSLMTPFLSFAEAIHDPGAIALCMFRDIGWTTSRGCEHPTGQVLSELADLILPGFEVHVADPQGPTTFFAVRNTSDSAVDVEVAYHGDQVTEPPLRTDVLGLGPQQTVSVNVRSDLTDLDVAGGFATGLILISEPTGSLEGDFFRLDQANAFATGDRLVRPSDFCQRQEIRFVEFGSGSELRILVDDPQGAERASFSYTAYSEGGATLVEEDFFTSSHLTVVDPIGLGIGNSFGTVVFDFTNSGGGWASAKYSAFGVFSVELNSACRD